VRLGVCGIVGVTLEVGVHVAVAELVKVGVTVGVGTSVCVAVDVGVTVDVVVAVGVGAARFDQATPRPKPAAKESSANRAIAVNHRRMARIVAPISSPRKTGRGGLRLSAEERTSGRGGVHIGWIREPRTS
jgi:hypothetical protein